MNRTQSTKTERHPNDSPLPKAYTDRNKERNVQEASVQNANNPNGNQFPKESRTIVLVEKQAS